MNRREFLESAFRAGTAFGVAMLSGIGRSAARAAEEQRAAIFKHIDDHQPEHIAKIQEYLRQPSVSAQNLGIKECADMTLEMLRRLGCREAELVLTGGHPGVWGFYDAGAKKTLVVYMMYDVQPVEPEQWSSPPFEARIVDDPVLGRKIVGRGAINTKGPERAFLNACESIVAVAGKLPVNLMFTAEGEEEIGSVHFPEFIQKYQDRLAKAHGVFFPSCDQDQEGNVEVYLGNKGIVYIELEASGARWKRGPERAEIHSSLKAIVDSPVWRLIHALASMTERDGNTIVIEGFRDKIVPPSPEDLELVEKLLERFDDNTWKKQLQVSRWINNYDKRTAVLKYLYETTLNIDGIWAGYTGPGPKTILPHKATAKIDVRLVPNQESKDVIPLIRRHLDRHGYQDVEIRPINGYEWSKTSVKTPLAQTLLATYKKYGLDPMVWPHLAGSAPFYVYTRPPINLPFILGGVGHGSGAHAPDEYLVIGGNPKVADLATIEKFFVDFLYAFAAA